MTKTILAILAAVAMVAPAGLVGADGTTTFTGFVAGATQGAYTGAPTETATHEFEAVDNGRGACTHTVTLSYNGIGGDNFFAATGADGLLFTAGTDYITHLYLFVYDGNGDAVAAEEWIEDDGWEQSALLGMEGAMPDMEHSATVSGACGTWEFVVDAHRGAAEYTIEIA